jgi:hypothetical protein
VPNDTPARPETEEAYDLACSILSNDDAPLVDVLWALEVFG